MLKKMAQYWYTVHSTPIGPMTLVATSTSLVDLNFGEAHPSQDSIKDPARTYTGTSKVQETTPFSRETLGQKHANSVNQEKGIFDNHDNKRLKVSASSGFKSKPSETTEQYESKQLLLGAEADIYCSGSNSKDEICRESTKSVQLKWYDPKQRSNDVNDVTSQNEKNSNETTISSKSSQTDRKDQRKAKEFPEKEGSFYVYMSEADLQKSASEDKMTNHRSSALARSNVESGEHVLRLTKQQLDEYFQGKRKTFTVPLDVSKGTPFQREVWDKLCDIPYGETRTYADVARKLSSEKSQRGYRAVGNANNRNPISLLIPCHRVIQASGALGGYGGGCDFKEWLLDHEAKYA